MIPFKKTPLTDATNPVKLFEFLSAGKPVVATDLEEIRNYADQVRLATTPEEWLQGLEEALKDRSPEKASSRVEFALQNTWEHRYSAVQDAVLALYGMVSIIVVTFNNVDYTRQCLQSIYAKPTYPRFEVVVVDNASTDATPEFLESFAAAHSNVKVILNKENKGFAHANNQGIQAANGEYIVLLNNDTVVTSGWLSRLVYYLRDQAIGLVGPVTNGVWNEARVEVGNVDPEAADTINLQIAREKEGRVTPIKVLAMYCVAGRKEVFERVGPLDERFGIGMFEDDDYALRVRQAGYRLAVAEDIFIFHFARAGFKQLGEERYMQLFNENRSKFEAKWQCVWDPHSKGTLGQNRRIALELRRILADHTAAPGVVIFPPTIGWSISLFQRPHQLARSFARKGWLVFFCIQDNLDQVDGFKEVEPGLYLSRTPEAVFDLVERPVVFTLPYNRQHLLRYRRPVVVYEVIDDLEVFPGDQAQLHRDHEALLKDADLVLVTADRLMESVRGTRPDALECPNAVEFEHFAGSSASSSPPASIGAILANHKPIIGYYGALARWFDYELLKGVATLRPEWQFVLIGPDHDSTLPTSGLLSKKNVHWLGTRPYAELPLYLRYFDVAIIPFVINNITLATSPLKLFEYMAAGKPVVTTDLPECRKYDVVLTAASPQEFVNCVEDALRLGHDPAYQVRLTRTAADNTWDARVDQILFALHVPGAPHVLQAAEHLNSWPALGKAGPVFTAAIQRHHEPNKSFEMYPVWLNYSLETNQRGLEVLLRLKDLADPRGKRHLDIGCAYAGTCVAFARAGGESVGIETDARLFPLAKANLQDHPGLPVRILQRDVTKTEELADLGQFDIITCDNVIEHVLDAEKTIRNISQLLAPGGLCHLVIPNARSVPEIRHDGHYGQFGITLLPHERAKSYYLATNLPDSYGVGDYFELDRYEQMLANAGLSFQIVDHVQNSSEEIERLRRDVMELRGEFEHNCLAGKVPATAQQEVGQALESYIAEFSADYDQYINAGAGAKANLESRLLRDYRLDIWHVIARKLS